MKESNIPILAKFLENLCNKNLSKKINNKIYDSFYEKFSNYIQVTKTKYDMTETKFGIEIKEYIDIVKKRSSKGIVYSVDFIKLKDYLIKKYNIQDINDLEFIDDDDVNKPKTNQKINDLDV